MTIRQLYFQFGRNTVAAQAIRRLRDLGFVAAGPARTLRETYFDSFDWRFFSAGRGLRAIKEGKSHRLQWFDLARNSPLAIAEYMAIPRAAADLPMGDVRTLASPLLGCRALIPLLIRQVKLREYRLLDRREKTVVRLIIEESRHVDPGVGGAGKALPAAVRLLPVKGYEGKLQYVQQFLIEELGLGASHKNSFEIMLRAAGLMPGDYSSKIDVKLAPGSSADAALRQLLLTLLDVMEANEAGVTEDLDSEFLHDFRVAIRRARSALSQLKGVFPEALVAPYQKALSELAAGTGPTRDMDVYLLALPRFESFLAAEFRSGLAPIIALIEVLRRQEFAKLKAQLTGRCYQSFKQRWRQFLEMPRQPGKKPDITSEAETPVVILAARRIWRLYSRLRKNGRAISSLSPASDLHDLRKQAKKLRYMFEFFKGLYGAEEVTLILQTLKKLQQNLGEIQDYEVQADHLTALASELEMPGSEGKQTYMAVGMLTAYLTDLRVQARDEFAMVFADFDSAKVHRLFVKLFQRPGGIKG